MLSRKHALAVPSRFAALLNYTVAVHNNRYSVIAKQTKNIVLIHIDFIFHKNIPRSH